MLLAFHSPEAPRWEDGTQINPGISAFGNMRKTSSLLLLSYFPAVGNIRQVTIVSF